MDVKPSNPISKVPLANPPSQKDENLSDVITSEEATAHKKKIKALKKKLKKARKRNLSSEEKHLFNWQSSRSAVAVMQSTKDYHVHLTTLSDQKANIVIAASSIIISVCLSQISNYSGVIGAALLILISFTTIALMFAILSVSPIVSKKAKHMKLDNPAFNPFFFGHYTDVDLPDYTEHMIQILKNQDTMYSEMIKDLYQMGMVLKLRKFKYLTYSYRVFFVGILVSFVICIIGFLF